MAYHVEEVAFTSSAGLLRIAALATAAFALMTYLTWHGLRGLTLGAGGLIVGGLLTVAAWYWFQERYPRATLFADQPFDSSSPFHGYVETDERTVQNRSVRVQLLFYLGLRGGPISLSKQKVSREQIRNSNRGRVHIPFSFPPPGQVGRNRVILRVRTPFFPFGWGATFAVWPRE